MTGKVNKVIKIDYLARVEGEGGVSVEIADGKLTGLRLRIFEAPRFFESLVRGRPCSDVIDFTARICGICPVAYQMSSVHAIEKIFGVEIEKPVRDLRRLLYAGEWIESHALHVYLLHGPDFYGIESAWSDREYIPVARRGLGFKRLGNRILSILGGRSVHPVSVRIGGFYRVPEKKELASISGELQRAYEESLMEIEWASHLPFDDNVRDVEYVSLSHADEYPMNEGRVVSNRGLDESMDGFMKILQEYQVGDSTALYSGIKRDSSLSPYLVGPIARLNLNYERLPSEIRERIEESPVVLPITNTQMSIVARSVEMAYAFHEALRIIKDYEKPDRPSVAFEPRAGKAVWMTEAPRGILIHSYELNNEGEVLHCALIPPTSQNLSMIENELRRYVQINIHLDTASLKKGIERTIRAYDPCISCSAHLLDVRITR